MFSSKKHYISNKRSIILPLCSGWLFSFIICTNIIMTIIAETPTCNMYYSWPWSEGGKVFDQCRTTLQHFFICIFFSLVAKTTNPMSPSDYYPTLAKILTSQKMFMGHISNTYDQNKRTLIYTVSIFVPCSIYNMLRMLGLLLPPMMFCFYLLFAGVCVLQLVCLLVPKWIKRKPNQIIVSQCYDLLPSQGCQSARNDIIVNIYFHAFTHQTSILWYKILQRNCNKNCNKSSRSL